MQYEIVRLLCVLHLQQEVFPLEAACVPHLSTRFAVEWCAVQNHNDRSTLLSTPCEPIVRYDSHHIRLRSAVLITQKLRTSIRFLYLRNWSDVKHLAAYTRG